MNKFFFIALFLVVVAVLSINVVLASSPLHICGSSGGIVSESVSQQLHDEQHVRYQRLYFMWRYAQPKIKKSEIDSSLTIEKVAANPKKYVDDWSETVPNWKSFDRQLEILCNLKNGGKKAILPILEVIEGTVTGLPEFIDDGDNNNNQKNSLSSSSSAKKPSATKTKYCDPCNLGRSAYLAYTYRWVRAVTKRYAHRIRDTCGGDKNKTIIFQIENELNEALLSIVYGQRALCLAWANWTYVTEVLSTYRLAVKAEAPFVQVTQNLHTDVPESFHRALHLPGFYLDAAKEWNHILDIISADAYPNGFFIAYPIRGHVVGERVAAIRNVTNNEKEVYVAETGYPVLDESVQPQPPQDGRVMNFSILYQAEYATQVVQSVLAAGGAGVCWFEAISSKGMLPPSGGYSQADVSMFKEARTFLLEQNVTQLVDWLLEPGNAKEVADRAMFFLTRADHEHGWAMWDENMKPLPVFHALAKEFSKICP